MIPPNWRWTWFALVLFGSSPSPEAADSPTLTLDPALAAAVREAGAPILQTASSPTARDFSAQHLAFYRRTLLPAMQAAVKGKAWEAEALKYGEDCLVAWNHLEPENRTQVWTELAARGEALIKGGCDEPTARFFAARFKVGERSKKETAALYRAVLGQVEADPRYSRCFVCIVAANLGAMLPAPDAELEQKILSLRRASFEEGSYRGDDDALFVDELLNAPDHLHRDSDATEKLVLEIKTLPEWARKTILGNVELGRGWKARGNGWADSVSDKASAEYMERLTKAGQYLEAAWKLRPDQPYAAADMILVSMDSGPGSTQRARLWFDRTVKTRFDYDAAYGTYTAALRPRWGGTHEQMLAFGRACAATKRYDTKVPIHLINVLEDIGKEIADRREIFLMPSIIDEVIAMDKGYVATSNRPFSLDSCLSDLVLDAWLCHRWEDGKAALEQLPDQKLSASLRNRMLFFGTAKNNVIGETLIYLGAAKDDYAKARALDREERYEEATAYYAATLKKCMDQPVPRTLIEFFMKLNDSKIEFAKGQWMDISPKAVDNGEWQLSNQAKCSVPRDGVLEVTGNGGSPYCCWRRPVGNNYELRATFEFSTPLDKPHSFAVIMGETPLNPGQPVTCHFSSNSTSKGTVNVLRGFTTVRNPAFETALEMKNLVSIQCWQGRISLYLNGKAVFENFRPVEGSASDHGGGIGFGGVRMSPEERFRVSEIMVRALKEEPASMNKRGKVIKTAGMSY